MTGKAYLWQAKSLPVLHTCFKMLGDQEREIFPVPLAHRKAFWSGEIIPSDEMLALILFALKIRNRQDIARHFVALRAADASLRMLTHRKTLVAPAFLSEDEQDLAGYLPFRDATVPIPVKALSFSDFTRRYHLADKSAHKILKKFLKKIPFKDRAQWAYRVVLPEPLKPRIVITCVLKDALLEARRISPDLPTKAPEGWISISHLRRQYTDSEITMRGAVARALALLQERGFQLQTLQRYAHAPNRARIPYYSPLVQQVLAEDFCMKKQAERHDYPSVASLKNYRSLNEWRKEIRTDFNSIKAIFEREAALRPAEDRVSMTARSANGTLRVVYSEGFGKALIAAGHFKETAAYFEVPERPAGWVSSTQLSKKYTGNKARMIRLLQAFQDSLEPDKAPAMVGRFRLQGKVGLFINPACLGDLEKRNNGLKLRASQ